MTTIPDETRDKQAMSALARLLLFLAMARG